MRLIAIGQGGDEGDGLAGRDNDTVSLWGELHRRDRPRERQACRQLPCPEIPPSMQQAEGMQGNPVNI